MVPTFKDLQTTSAHGLLATVQIHVTSDSCRTAEPHQNDEEPLSSVYRRFPHASILGRVGDTKVSMPDLLPPICDLCQGTGFRLTERANGDRFAQSCTCRVTLRNARTLSQARIPRRYEHCTLDSFETQFGSATPSLSHAHLAAKKFVQTYPLDTNGIGILLTGNIGVGKTHLAVGILQAMIERGAQGLFFDYRELLKQVQHSYNPAVAATELGILEPIFNAEILVLDEIGASKPTDWVWDTVSHILNTRYNDRRTTILTTNYANLPPAGVEVQGTTPIAVNRYREDTLGDRIGERMRSRLQEMCVVMEMRGEDFRQRVKRATFA